MSTIWQSMTDLLTGILRNTALLSLCYQYYIYYTVLGYLFKVYNIASFWHMYAGNRVPLAFASLTFSFKIHHWERPILGSDSGTTSLEILDENYFNFHYYT